MNLNAEKLVAIVGPTGVGKTGAAVRLAQELGTNLLSVDSQQVYAGMDIGTGKEVSQGRWREDGRWSVLDIEGVGIYGLNLTTPDKPMNVAEWRRLARQIMESHRQASKPLILVGGTGLYVQSLLKNSPEMEVPRNEELRRELSLLSAEQLLARLMETDGVKAEGLNYSDRRNPVRLVRAIEIVEGKPQMSRDQSVGVNDMSLGLIGLTMVREELYRKVDERVDQMMEEGLLNEVEGLVEQYGMEQQALKAIGYAQLIEYLRGEITLPLAVERVKHQTHDYIRRQYTWFQKQDVEWVDVAVEGWSGQLRQKVIDILSVD